MFPVCHQDEEGKFEWPHIFGRSFFLLFEMFKVDFSFYQGLPLDSYNFRIKK